MIEQDRSLPAGFETLEPFVEFWAVDTAAGRARCRDSSDEASRAAFYGAASDLVPKALAHLDAQGLSQLDESEQRLMRLVLSFAHVSMAVELQREQEPRHARDRASMRITRAPADQPGGQATRDSADSAAAAAPLNSSRRRGA